MSRIAFLTVGSSTPCMPEPTRWNDSLDALGGPSHWRVSQNNSSVALCAWKGVGIANLAQSGPLTLCMDGIIYNCPDDVIQDGRSDASWVLKQIESYGLETVLKDLNGDFAFLLYDERDRTLTVARDRMGLRPLYYTQFDGKFACASRPAALLALGVNPDINIVFTGLFAGSHYRLIDNDIHASPYAHIKQLPAGHLLQWHDGNIKIKTWWQPKESAEYDIPEKDLCVSYRELFLDAVRIRQRRFSQPFYTLSGGMDSSAILASARHLQGKKQECISIVYEDDTYDESSQIAIMLEENSAHWHKILVGTPDVFSLIQRMITHHDEPVATATWLPHWLMCEYAVNKGANGLSSGLGGDELFGGEYEHFLYYFADLKFSAQNELLGKEVDLWAQYHNHPLYPKNRNIAEAAISKLTTKNGLCLHDRARIDRYATALNPDFFAVQHFEPIMEHPFSSYLTNRCWQDIQRETSPCCIRAQDRNGMALGLPTFMPFFDFRLVDFLFKLPAKFKIHNGTNKYLPRKAMRGILPNQTCDNIVKTGWNAPAHVWFSGKNFDTLMDLIHSQSFRERGIYNVQEVLRLAKEHEHIVSNGLNSENHMMFFWQLVNMEFWLQQLTKK